MYLYFTKMNASTKYYHLKNDIIIVYTILIVPLYTYILLPLASLMMIDSN